MLEILLFISEILACLDQLLFERNYNYTFSKAIILGILFVCLGCLYMRPHTVDGSEIPNNNTSVNSGIHLLYQPRCGISEPSTGYRVYVNPVFFFKLRTGESLRERFEHPLTVVTIEEDRVGNSQGAWVMYI